MISNFALLLSHEGIQLAHRTPDGWASLGSVSLLDEDIHAKLSDMRDAGIAIAAGAFSTKIVLPGDQIKYLTLPEVDDDAREDAIREALEKTTPYLIDELVYDWEASDEGMNIAAVARDTLAEAENFIVGHGFNPVCFVAAPDDALFSVEPFFGACSKYADDPDYVDSIEAEVDKVILVTPTEAPMAEVVDDLGEDEAEPVAIVERPRNDDDNSDENGDQPPLVDVETVADVASESVFNELEETAEIAASSDAQAGFQAPQEDDAPKDDEALSEEKSPAGLVATRGQDADGTTPILGPATRTTSILGGKEPAIRRAPDAGRGAGVDDDVLDRSFPSWAGAGGTRKDDGEEKETLKAAGWLRDRQTAKSEDDTVAPPSWMQTDNAPVSESEFEEDQEEAAWVKAPVGAVNLMPAGSSQPRYEELSSDEERFQIFGARDGGDSSAGWNRGLLAAIFIGLVILIAGGFFGVRMLGNAPAPDVAQAPLETPAQDLGETTDPVANTESGTDTAVVTETDVEDQVTQPSDEAAPVEPDIALVEDVAPDVAPSEIDVAPDQTTAEVSPEATDVDVAPLIEPVTNAIEADTLAAQQADAPEPSVDTDLPTTNELASRDTEDTPSLASPDGDELPETQLAPPASPITPQTEVAETIAPQSQILSAAPSAAVIAPTRPITESPEIPEVAALEESPADDATLTQAPAEPADLLATSGSDWDGLSPEARDARYAATGIWPLAPSAPVAPRGETLGQLYIAALDPSVFATDAFAITETATLLSDKALTTQPNPPAAGTRFERDERGLVLATLDGALTPDGVKVFSGIPPILPPLAPREDPAGVQAAQRAALQGLVPQLRPVTEGEAEDTADAAEPEVDVAALAEPATAAETPEQTGNRPPLRPPAIAALAVAAPVARENPLALAETPVPRLRPATMGQIVYSTERATIAAQTTSAVAPSSATAAAQATQEDAITLRGINLIGIYGESGDRRALVRLQSGRYSKIEVGDSLNGGRVTAIDTDRLIYQRNGQAVVLRMPAPN